MAGRAGEERGRERPLRHPQPHAPQDLYRATQGDAGVCVCVCVCVRSMRLNRCALV